MRTSWRADPVAPPDDVSVWIYAELVRKSHVVRDKAQIRSGPGPNYKVVGSLEQDTPVELRGRIGDWLKIKPLARFSLWISRSAIVELPASAKPTDTLALPPAMATGLLSALNDDTNGTATTTNVAFTTTPFSLRPSEIRTNTVTQQPPPPELPSSLLTASPLQGCHVRFTGTLRATIPGATIAPAHYRLTGPDRTGGIVTFCHLLDPAQLTAIPNGSKISIEGPAWWLKGESVPLVAAEKITVTPDR